MGAEQTETGKYGRVTMIKSAETAGFDDRYRHGYRPVVAPICTLSDSQGAAEELAHDVPLEAHRRRDSISDYGDPGAWIRKVAMSQGPTDSNLPQSRFLYRMEDELPAANPMSVPEPTVVPRRGGGPATTTAP